MIRIIKIMLLMVFAFTASLFAQPKLEIEGGSTYDWGTVKPNDSPLKAKIKLFNKGTDTLRIEEVKPGCGCTTAPLDKNVIEPGGFATLDVTLNAGSASGVLNKSITIKSNMPNNQFTSLYLKANIFRPVTFVGQNYFNYGDIMPNEEHSRKVTLKNNIDKEIKIVKIEKLPDFCKTSIKEGTIIPPNSEIEIEVTVIRDIPGPFNFPLKIQTDQSDEADLFISGWGSVRDTKVAK